jgi:DNA-directed RNA polymerase subunit M/transcription elongation factor TFIIS
MNHQMWCLILHPKGTSRNATISADRTEVLDAAEAGKLLRRATPPERLGTWTWMQSGVPTVVYLFGYKTGKAGTDMTQKLPKPHNGLVLYGEVLLCASQNGQLVSFDNVSFKTFCADMSGGDGTGAADGGEGDEEDEDGDEDEDEDEEDEEDEAVDEEDAEEDVVEDEEDEDDTPLAKIIVKVSKPKKGTKKIAAWYALDELKPEPSDVSTTTVNDVRQKVLNVISGRFRNMSVVEQHDLERGIYNTTLEDAKRRGIRAVWQNPELCALYDICARRTISNLDAASYIGNKRLAERFEEGEFKPHDVPAMVFHELRPELWGDLIELSIKREAKMLEVDKSMATDMFRCSRCGKRQCTYYEMQTRSADEPMTQFIRCLNCNKQWKQ